DAVDVIDRLLMLNGIEVSSFTNPFKALEVFRSNFNAFGTVVSDIRMPKLDGIALAKSIRRISADVRIILMTAYDVTLTQDEMKSYGITELLKKPFSGSKLASVITNRSSSKIP